MTQDEAREGFLNDLQAVMDKWDAYIEDNGDGYVRMEVFSGISMLESDQHPKVVIVTCSVQGKNEPLYSGGL